MKNLRSFNITYAPYTETKSNRVRIRDNRNKKTIFIPYDNSTHNGVEYIAQDYLDSLGIEVEYFAQDKKGFVLLSSNFETDLR